MGMLKEPFSIVIPAYNEEALIGDCIKAVHAELGHWNIDYEIIVVDNNCTDNTKAIAELLGCKVIACAEKGITRARQAGLLAARGEIVAFIDADNMVPSGWFLFAYVQLLNKDAVAISGPLVYSDMPRRKRLVAWVFYRLGALAHKLYPMLQGGNFVIKKSALLKAGGFDTEIDFYGEDTATAIRMAKVGKVIFDTDMYAYSSPRRMDEEGLWRTGLRYTMNYAWMHLTDHPFTKSHKDIRP